MFFAIKDGTCVKRICELLDYYGKIVILTIWHKVLEIQH